jgi:hypothetical protein
MAENWLLKFEAIDSATVKGTLDMMATHENTVNVESSFAAQRLGVDCMDHKREDPKEHIVGLGNGGESWKKR